MRSAKKELIPKLMLEEDALKNPEKIMSIVELLECVEHGCCNSEINYYRNLLIKKVGYEEYHRLVKPLYERNPYWDDTT